jgi:hypothetical protein
MTAAVGNSARANVCCGSATAILRLMPVYGAANKEIPMAISADGEPHRRRPSDAAGPPGIFVPPTKTGMTGMCCTTAT